MRHRRDLVTTLKRHADRNMLDFLNDNSGALTVIFTGIVTISTVAYAVLTERLVSETRRLRRAETEPAIVVYLSTNEHWINLFDLVIQNHGKGIARNIRWCLSPSRVELSKAGVKAASMALFDGFSQLAPGQQVRAFFGSALELLKEPAMEPITVSVAYQNDLHETLTASFVLDVNQFRGISEVGKDADVRIADAIEKVARNLSSVVSGHRISVLVQTQEEVQREHEAVLARISAQSSRGSSPPLDPGAGAAGVTTPNSGGM